MRLHPVEEKLEEYVQNIFLIAESSSGLSDLVEGAVETLKELSENGFEKVMKLNHLDVLVTPGASASSLLAIGGYPEITVPAEYYGSDGVPVWICFRGLRGSEPTLIETAYSFEQATKIRKAPTF